MEKRYAALRTIGAIYKVLGYIILVLTILAAIAFCGFSVIGSSNTNSISQQVIGTSGVVGGILLALGTVIYGGIMALSLIAFGEGISLLISLEENTRRTSFMLESQNKPPAPNP